MFASVRSLLAKVIDYAGLFPPASLSMSDAVEEYLRHVTGAEAWIVTGFICPSNRLGEFEASRRSRPLELILLSTDTPDSDEALQSIEHVRSLDGVRYRGWEGKIPPLSVERREVAELLARCRIEAGVHAFLEVPVVEGWRDALPAALDAIREDGRFMAKLRTGGTTPDLIPSPEAVAQFLIECAHRSLPIKFTAGLHQATYHFDKDVGAYLFGFLNALLGGMFAFTRTVTDENELVELLTETEPSAFAFDHESIRWKDKHLTVEQIRDARSLVRSFGSCSVDEPIQALEALGLWKDAAPEVVGDA
ncbi:MAG: hypothetical protein C4342_01335 [Armatimonadota bacterium]